MAGLNSMKKINAVANSAGNFSGGLLSLAWVVLRLSLLLREPSENPGGQSRDLTASSTPSPFAAVALVCIDSKLGILASSR